MCMLATVPSARLTGNRISEAEWVQFIQHQKEKGYGWAIADFEHFKHLIPRQPAPATAAAPAAAAAAQPVDAIKREDKDVDDADNAKKDDSLDVLSEDDGEVKAETDA
jgi:hypothetical protein